MDNIDYICKNMLNLDWSPEISTEAAEILDLCDSTLEKMYILGACHFIEKIGLEGNGAAPINLSESVVSIDGEIYRGIWVLEPWSGWYLDELPQELQSGPSALLFVPQYKSPEKKITHDFALFYGDDNGSPKWTRKHVIEIDGYGVHKERREKDSLRDSSLSYDVVRFYEETDDPREWFKKIVLKDAGYKNS